MGYIWLNIPLALFFFACWAGIPLYLTLTRWNAELRAKHAELALPAAREPVPAVAPRSDLTYAGAGYHRER